MENDTSISCLAWILRGYAASVPRQIQLSQQEIQEMRADPMIAQGLRQEEDIQQMQQDQDSMPHYGQDFVDMINGNSKHPNFIQQISDDQKQDYFIRDTDALIVAGKIQKQFSCLQVYIYQQTQNNLFVHHQIMLSAFPLDIQWLRVNLGSLSSNNPSKGNYAIVSTFLPQIQFWNLDLTQAIEPDLILGGELVNQSKKPKKFTNKAKKYKPGSHTDAVISLSLNYSNLSVLASGSIDTTVKIWDISKKSCVHTATHHNTPLKKVQWSPIDHSIIFTSSQQQISILDSRYPGDSINHKASQKIQSACWNTNNQSQIVYATQSGSLNIFDVRKSNALLASIKAHNSQINDVKVVGKNLCFTCSQDQTVRIWNLNDLSQPIAAKNPKCGILLCLDILQQPSGPVLSAGNSHGQLFVWDVTENERVDAYWKNS